jgi:hypothetical protein
MPANRCLRMDDPGHQPEKPPGRRQFSLRTLLLVVTAVAGLLSLLSAFKWSPEAAGMIATVAVWVVVPYLDRHLTRRGRTLVVLSIIVVVILSTLLANFIAHW